MVRFPLTVRAVTRRASEARLTRLIVMVLRSCRHRHTMRTSRVAIFPYGWMFESKKVFHFVRQSNDFSWKILIVVRVSFCPSCDTTSSASTGHIAVTTVAPSGVILYVKSSLPLGTPAVGVSDQRTALNDREAKSVIDLFGESIYLTQDGRRICGRRVWEVVNHINWYRKRPVFPEIVDGTVLEGVLPLCGALESATRNPGRVGQHEVFRADIGSVLTRKVDDQVCGPPSVRCRNSYRSISPDIDTSDDRVIDRTDARNDFLITYTSCFIHRERRHFDIEMNLHHRVGDYDIGTNFSDR